MLLLEEYRLMDKKVEKFRETIVNKQNIIKEWELFETRHSFEKIRFLKSLITL